MSIAPWKVLHSEHVLRDRWITVRADRCETATGVVIDPYYVQESPDWIQVVAFNHDNRLLVTRQYRHGAREICTEIPCGVMEPGEAPAEAAARELLEETGCEARAWHALPVLSPNPARYANRIHAFVALGTQRTCAQRLDETEEIELEFLPIEDVLRLIDFGQFLQALHVASVFMALRWRGI